MKSYNVEVMAQANAVLTISNSVVMAKLEHMTVIMNTMQEQLNILSSD